MFLVEGPQAVAEALSFHFELVVELYLTRARPRSLHRHRPGGRGRGRRRRDRLRRTCSRRWRTRSPRRASSRSAGSSRCRCASSLNTVATVTAPSSSRSSRRCAIPGNAGTIIRAADAAGADGVIFTGNSVDAYNPKVVRSTTGSLFHLPIAQGGPWRRRSHAVRDGGMQVLAADVKGDDLPLVRDRPHRSDHLAVRQRGARPDRRDARACRSRRQGAHLRARRVDESGDRGIRLPVRVRVRAERHGHELVTPFAQPVDPD